MVDRIRDILKWRSIAGVNFVGSAAPVLAQPRLLAPPSIDLIDLDFYKGQVRNHILIMTSDDFGIESVYVRIRDGEGTLIESGDALPWLQTPGVWHYVSTTHVPRGTTVTIYAAVTDSLGAVGACSAHLTIA
jgi:hypothetical protein